MTILSITFDLEGTLVDIELAHHLGHLAIAHELGLAITLEEARVRFPSFVGGPDAAVAAELKLESGAGMTIDDIVARTRELYTSLRAGVPIRPRSGAVRFLKETRERGYSMALGSVTSCEDGRALLEAAGLTEYFSEQTRVFLEDVPEPKPAPAVYIETAKRLGINPAEQLVFEDSPSGVAAARSAGSSAIAVPAIKNDTVRDRLYTAGASHVFDDWTDVTFPTVLKLIQ